MKTVAKFAVLLLIGTLALGMFVQTGFAQSSEQARNNKPAAADSVPTPVAGSDYVIGADDTLQISVWKEPDLTESLPVRPDGKISLPLLNDIPAAGLTPMQLKDSITEKLRKYIADPRVTVVVTAMNSRRVFVTDGSAAVTKIRSRRYLLVLDMDLLAQNEELDLEPINYLVARQEQERGEVVVLSVVANRQVKLPFNYKDVVKGNHPEQNIALKPGDTVVVP